MLTSVLVVVMVLCPGPLPGRLGGTLVVDVARLLEGEDRRSFPECLWFSIPKYQILTFPSIRVFFFWVSFRSPNSNGLTSYLNCITWAPDESFRVFRFHMLRQEEVPVDLVHIVVGLGEVRVQGVDRLLAIVRKQRRNLGKIPL